MNKKTIKDIDLKGKKVFVRCDFNVPLDEQGNINVEALHEELLKQARKSPVTFNLPMLGNVTLNEADVQKLYSDIVGM